MIWLRRRSRSRPRSADRISSWPITSFQPFPFAGTSFGFKLPLEPPRSVVARCAIVHPISALSVMLGLVVILSELQGYICGSYMLDD